ncbi:MAG: hypothetical protein OXD01_11150 [Gammaproteobacteria bacterium]|nr:hypothetical protein [Gammaproteobacteria bacterium]
MAAQSRSPRRILKIKVCIDLTGHLLATRKVFGIQELTEFAGFSGSSCGAGIGVCAYTHRGVGNGSAC